MSTVSKIEVPPHNSSRWSSFINEIQYTDQWKDFVFSLFRKEELIDGYPSADGLWRIARYIFKCPLSYKTSVFKSPTVEDGGATVAVELTYIHYTYCGAADVNPGNTKEPFNRHPTATAETKALGRAVKKLLGLSIHTYEEMLDEGGFDRISANQVKSIKNLCDKLKVNYPVFLSEHTGLDTEAFESEYPPASKEQAFQMLEVLNSFQGKKGVIPEHLALK